MQHLQQVNSCARHQVSDDVNSSGIGCQLRVVLYSSGAFCFQLLLLHVCILDEVSFTVCSYRPFVCFLIFPTCRRVQDMQYTSGCVVRDTGKRQYLIKFCFYNKGKIACRQIDLLEKQNLERLIMQIIVGIILVVQTFKRKPCT